MHAAWHAEEHTEMANMACTAWHSLSAPAQHPHLLQASQLIWELLYVVAVEVQPVETGQATDAGRDHSQLVL